MSVVFFALLAGGVVGVLVWSRRRGRIVAGALWTSAALAALWLVVVALVSRDVAGTSGFFDCRDCTASQEAAGVVLFWTPMLILLLFGIIVFSYYRPARGREES